MWYPPERQIDMDKYEILYMHLRRCMKQIDIIMTDEPAGFIRDSHQDLLELLTTIQDFLLYA